MESFNFEKVNKENLKENIESCITNLLGLVKINCWNKISSNYVFIVSDLNDFERSNFFQQRKARNKVNKSKITISLNSAIEILYQEYQDLYDVNLYIFEAGKKETIIEIRYYRKSNLEPDYLKLVKDNEPMYHSKILKPYYVKDSNKFDVNWEHGGLRYFWNHFLTQIKYRINT